MTVAPNYCRRCGEDKIFLNKGGLCQACESAIFGTAGNEPAKAPEPIEAKNEALRAPETLPAKPALMVAPRNLAPILDQVEDHVCRFIGFRSSHEPVAVALFTAHCYAVESAPMAAYLRVRSAAEESGKTTLLEVEAQLLRGHAINAVSVSPSVVYRLREKVGPVALLLDETDNGLAKRQDDSARDLLSIVNAGYRRSATVYRTEGRSFEPRAFAAFGPAVVAGIGYLEPTTESRCIPIALPRKPRGSLERFIAFLVEPSAIEIAEQLEAWATPEVIDQLRSHTPDYPAELRDRHVEVWWNLFSIADLAGGDWPQRAREAALALHVGNQDESMLSVQVLLIAHIRQAFDEDGIDRLPTVNLLERLASNEQGPWGKWWGAELNRDGPPLAAAADLARKLRGFEGPDGPIKPRNVRLPDGTIPKGYHREDFEPAWAIYLGDVATQTATPPQTATPLTRDVADVAGVAAPHPNDEEDSTAMVTGGWDGGAEICPECDWRWFHGHAEDCSRKGKP